ncbi:MAG: hypothetical protein ACP5N7_04215 [Candidatus Pacearchaeota archaeon]
MQSIIDNVLIEAVKDEKALHAIPNTEIKLIIPTQFNPYEEERVTQSGTVVSAPLYYTVTYKDSEGKNKTKRYSDVKIKKGDKVYCHHFLTHDENHIEGNLWRDDYSNIYCRIVDGEIEMVGRWNFLDIVNKEEKAGEIVLVHKDNKEAGVGILRHASDFMKSQGIESGMLVEFKKNAGYVMVVEGKKYYRLEDEHILLAHTGKNYEK